MTPKLRLAGVLFRGDPVPAWNGAWDFLSDYPPSVDGVAVYELMGVNPYPEAINYIRQPFRSQANGGQFQFAPGNRGNVWAWDGNRTAPTLTPSFSFNPEGKPPWPHIHLYLKSGRIEEDTKQVEVVS